MSYLSINRPPHPQWIEILVYQHIHQFRVTRALTLFNDVPLRTRKGLSLYKVYACLAPFWFSTEHRWTALTPFWYSCDGLRPFFFSSPTAISYMSCRKHPTVASSLGWPHFTENFRSKTLPKRLLCFFIKTLQNANFVHSFRWQAHIKRVAYV